MLKINYPDLSFLTCLHPQPAGAEDGELRKTVKVEVFTEISPLDLKWIELGRDVNEVWLIKTYSIKKQYSRLLTLIED